MGESISLTSYPEPNMHAIHFSLCCKQFAKGYEELIEEILSSRFVLGYEAWVSMFEHPEVIIEGFTIHNIWNIYADFTANSRHIPAVKAAG